MSSLIRYTGSILIYLTMAVVIYGLIFSDYFNEMYWIAVDYSSNDEWYTYTLEGGDLRYEAYTNIFDASDGDTFYAID